MGSFIYTLQAFYGVVSVDLGGREGTVAEELLNGVQVCSAFQEFRCKGMPKDVG